MPGPTHRCCSAPGALALLPRELLVELGHVVIPLGLVAGARHRRAQPVLAAEGGHLELAALVPGAVGQHGLAAGQLLRLLVHQPHVAVQPCGEGRRHHPAAR